GGKREQRLAGAGLTEQRYEIDLRVEQQIEREGLLPIARRDAPDVVALVGVVLERLQDRRLAARFLHLRVEWTVRLEVQEFVHQQARAQGAAYAVISVASLLPGLHLFRVPVPEVGGQLARAGVQEIG